MEHSIQNQDSQQYTIRDGFEDDDKMEAGIDNQCSLLSGSCMRRHNQDQG